jgi:glycosyltransferase involved in cell wall biosynthesis
MMECTTEKEIKDCPLLIIQIPCFNEEETLPATIADLPREVEGFERVEWLVIDDGSSDRTVQVALDLGVHHIVSHSHNRGLAAAYMTGLDTALRLGADVIVNTDADNQYDASGIPDLVRPILHGQADMVVGERPIEQIEEFSRVKKILQRLGSRVVRAFSGTEVRDAASGFRAVSRSTAIRLRVFGRYTYTMETLVQAGWEGLVVKSVPVGVNPKTRESRLVRSIPRYVFRSATTIVRTFALYKPFRFFVSVGLPFFFLGVVLVTRWMLYYTLSDSYSSRLPSLFFGVAVLIAALQFVILAFIGDNLAANRRLTAELTNHQRQELVNAYTKHGKEIESSSSEELKAD